MPTEFTTPYFKHVGLSSSGRPILNDHEHDIIMKNGIGLYQGDYKVKNYQSGRLYLTNQRIIFVNDTHKNLHLSLDLSQIDTTELYNGFLKSSPKIILRLKDQNDHDTTNLREGEFTLTWVCPICSYSNDLRLSSSQFDKMKYCDSELPACNTCGVKCTYDVISKYFLLNNDTTQKAPIDLVSFDGSQCPNCTFINHPSMTKCEICGFKLIEHSTGLGRAYPPASKKNTKTSDVKLTLLEDIDSEIDLNIVKFSFRNGNQKLFYESLKASLQNHQTSDSVTGIKQNKDSLKTEINGIPSSQATFSNGIHGLTSHSQQQNYEDSLLLGKAVQDIDQLMSKAKDLISLSKKYQSFLMKTNRNDKAFDQNVELLQSSKTSLANLNHIVDNDRIGKSINNAKITNALNLLKSGKPSADTASKLPTLYLEELARNICDFLINGDVLDKKNGIITFYELYSMYNKARQINLITPEEAFDAIMKFEQLGLNLKVTKVSLSLEENVTSSSFFYIISKKNNNSSITAKIINNICANPGISIRNLQKRYFDMSFIILKTILDGLVYKGELVIDTTLEGNTYWPNEILNFAKTGDKIAARNGSVGKIRESKNMIGEIENPDNLAMSDLSSIFEASRIYSADITSERYKELEDLTFL